jgi:hypothetical protein
VCILAKAPYLCASNSPIRSAILTFHDRLVLPHGSPAVLSLSPFGESFSGEPANDFHGDAANPVRHELYECLYHRRTG